MEYIVNWVKKKTGSFEPAVTILDSKLRGLPDQMVQKMLQTLGFQIIEISTLRYDFQVLVDRR